MRPGLRFNRRVRERKPRPQSRPRPKTDWAGVAEWYDQHVGRDGSEFHQKVVHPGVLKLLGDVKGKRVFDIACGQGVLCRLLHERGASVVGADAAGPLIQLAREHGPAEIRYERIDARDLISKRFFEDASFDLITFVLAIQNMHPFAPVFDAVARLLVVGGRCVVVMMHPSYRQPKYSHWGIDDEAGVQYRRIERYLVPYKVPIVTNPGKKDGNYTWTFHRPLETYVRAAAKSGLLIDAIEEWASHKVSQPGPKAKMENEARENIPMFLAMRLVKISPVIPS